MPFNNYQLFQTFPGGEMPFFAIFVPHQWLKIEILILTNLDILGIDLYVFEDEKPNGKGPRTQKCLQVPFLLHQCRTRATREPKLMLCME